MISTFSFGGVGACMACGFKRQLFGAKRHCLQCIEMLRPSAQLVIDWDTKELHQVDFDRNPNRKLSALRAAVDAATPAQLSKLLAIGQEPQGGTHV